MNLWDNRSYIEGFPPVGTNVIRSTLQTSFPGSPGLYYPVNNEQPANLLNYSGGDSKLVKIPLQINDPTEEVLRSQQILITQYNKHKYQC